jgi:hypothetical protein
MHRLKWDHATMVDMVARRILECDALREAYGFSLDASRTSKGRWRVCLAVIPEDLGGNADVFAWIGSRTCDASDELNPRNVLTLLGEARTVQLRIFDRDDPELSHNTSLIGTRAMTEGAKALSRIRLRDTVYAEFSHLRPLVEKLRGRSSKYSEEKFASLFAMQAGSSEFDDLVASLKYAGFIRQAPNRQITIPMLYRPALGLDRQGRRSRSRNS